MIILFILLVIIAIGVLVSSESGKVLLNWILVVLGIAGLIGFVFCLVIFLIDFLNSSAFKNFIDWINNVWTSLLFLGGLWIFIWFLYYLVKSVKNEINNKFPQVGSFCHKHKITIKSTSLLIFFIIISVAISVAIYYITPQ